MIKWHLQLSILFTIFTLLNLKLLCRASSGAVLYGLTHPEDDVILHGVFFYLSLICSAINAFALCLSLNHQRRYPYITYKDNKKNKKRLARGIKQMLMITQIDCNNPTTYKNSKWHKITWQYFSFDFMQDTDPLLLLTQPHKVQAGVWRKETLC